ncbi:MAG TPA: histidine kinase [Streptosporangiaceae bacterium]|nr:histidine kinase [Streptosporangiaceae bacterium]
MPLPGQEFSPCRGVAAQGATPADRAQQTGAPAESTTPAEELLAEERARIGRDLHDLVIRRLFAVSLRLGGTLGMIKSEEAAQRVDDTIAELDQTIKLIRSVVFALEYRCLPKS